MILYVFKLFFIPAFDGDARWELVHIHATTKERACAYVTSRWGKSRSKIEYNRIVCEEYKNNPDAPIFYRA